MERRAAVAQLVDDRLVDRAHVLVDLRPIDAGHGRVGAHAAGVRAAVTVEDALVVLRGGHRHGGLAVAQRQQRELLALERLLDHHAALAEAPLHEEVLERLARLLLVGRDDDALARGQAVELQHDRVALDRAHALVDGVHRQPRGGRDAGSLHDLLGERLGALQARDLAGRPEGGDPARCERVDEPRDERRLGPDDDEVDGLALGRVGHRGDVLDRRLDEPRVARDARVAGSAQDLGRLRRAPQRAHDRVLAPPGTDDENLHRATSGVFAEGVRPLTARR